MTRAAVSYLRGHGVWAARTRVVLLEHVPRDRRCAEYLMLTRRRICTTARVIIPILQEEVARPGEIRHS